MKPNTVLLAWCLFACGTSPTEEGRGASDTGGRSGASGAGGASAGSGGVVAGTGGSSAGGNGGGPGAGTGGSAGTLGPNAPCLPVPTGVPLERDPSYGGEADSVYGIAFDARIDSQGRLVATGSHSSDSTMVYARRFDANGVPDPEFAGDGSAAYTVREGAFIVSTLVGLDNEDRVWIGAVSEQTGASDTFGSPVIARALEDGSLDASFGTNGLVTFRPRGEPADEAEYSRQLLRLDPVSRGMLVWGNAFFDLMLEDGSFDPQFPVGSGLFDGVISLDGDTIFVVTEDGVSARALDGSLRTNYFTNGVANLEEAGVQLGGYVVPLVDGRFLLALPGTTATLMRLTALGALDTTYGTNGILELEGACVSSTIRVGCDGRIYMLTLSETGTPEFCAMMLERDGTPPSAPPSGTTRWSAPDGYGRNFGAFDRAGRIVFYGSSGGASTVLLARYNPPWSTP